MPRSSSSPFARGRCAHFAVAASLAAASGALWAQRTSSAFAVGDGRTYVTAHHAIEGARLICIETLDGTSHEAEVLATDAASDLALLHSTVWLAPLPLSGPHEARSDMPLLTIGYPDPDVFGDDPKVHQGALDSLTGVLGEPDRMQVSVPIRSGHSGAPLLASSGRVVGVVVGAVEPKILALPRASDATIGYAVPVERVHALIGPLGSGAATAAATIEAGGLHSRRELVRRSADSVVLVSADPFSGTCTAAGSAGSLPLPRLPRMSGDLISSTDLLSTRRHAAGAAPPSTPMNDLAAARVPSSASAHDGNAAH